MEERRRTNRRTLESKLLIKRLDGSGRKMHKLKLRMCQRQESALAAISYWILAPYMNPF